MVEIIVWFNYFDYLSDVDNRSVCRELFECREVRFVCRERSVCRESVCMQRMCGYIGGIRKCGKACTDLFT